MKQKKRKLGEIWKSGSQWKIQLQNGTWTASTKSAARGLQEILIEQAKKQINPKI